MVRFGIVGTNFISDWFADACKKVEGAKCVAISSRDMTKASEFAKKHDIENCFDSYEKMAESGLLDAVYLGVPNSLHHPLALYFLNKGIAVLSEKVFASNYREAKEMFEAAKKNNLLISDAIKNIYTRNFQVLKEAIKSIGVIRRGELVFGKYSSRYDAYLNGENPTTFDPQFSNGAICDIGVYPLSICIGLFGKPKDVVARGVLLESGVDALGSALLIYDGFQINVSFSKVTDIKFASEIEGENGNVYLDSCSLLNHVYAVDRKSKDIIIESKDDTDKMCYEVKDFVDCMEKGLIESPLVSHQFTLDVLEVMDKIRKDMGVVFPADR